MADYLKPPVIEDIDLAAYHGRPGDVIGICARDDTQVTAVDIVLRDGAGVIKEQGPARPGGWDWRYTATHRFGPEEVITVEVTAHDRAGNATTASRLIARPGGTPEPP